MRKLIITLSAFALILSSTFINVSASNDKYVYSDDPFEIKNIEAKEKLN